MRFAALFLIPLAVWGQNELRFNLRHEPRTFHPLLASDDASETVRYLTSGVLLRVNRISQNLEPELAESWKAPPGGRSITFKIRHGVRFSDGTPFTAQDVAYTVQAVTDPALHSAVGESFTAGGAAAKATATSDDTVTVAFSTPVADLEKLFDQLSILSAKSPLKEKAGLGAFTVANYQAGSEVVLRRNPNYWKKDSAGRQLPYLDSVRLSIQQNREIEYTRFRRGEIQLINQVDPEIFDRLAREDRAAARDLGPSTDVDFLWFNQTPSSPLPAFKKEWFRSREFRLAVSEAINRADLCKVVYLGHATPALGPDSPVNRFWFDKSLKPQVFNPDAALRRLEAADFHLKDRVLRDRGGNAVEFSIVTNSGNRVRERMAALIQQDLEPIGIKVNIVTLDFPSLIERMTRSFNYEACLLGYTNVDLDPNEQMNVFLSSAPDHGWFPNQKAPATPWESEIDKLMREQSATSDRAKRKALFDRVQQIMRAEAPYIYLVNRNALVAVAPSVKGAQPSALTPQTYWNIEYLSLK